MRGEAVPAAARRPQKLQRRPSPRRGPAAAERPARAVPGGRAAAPRGGRLGPRGHARRSRLLPWGRPPGPESCPRSRTLRPPRTHAPHRAPKPAARRRRRLRSDLPASRAAPPSATTRSRARSQSAPGAPPPARKRWGLSGGSPRPGAGDAQSRAGGRPRWRLSSAASGPGATALPPNGAARGWRTAEARAGLRSR